MPRFRGLVVRLRLCVRHRRRNASRRECRKTPPPNSCALVLGS
jgi:hypothetical protein